VGPNAPVFLSSPHQTPHPFFRQPNPMAALHANIERELATSGLPSVILRPGMFAANTVGWWVPQIRAGDVVRWPYGAVETAGGPESRAWGAAVGHPAYVTTTVADLTGAPARSFHDWVAAHADLFRNAPGHLDL
jgi:hypothetical protein